MKRILFAAALLVLPCAATFSQVATPSKEPRPGVLLLAHGGSLEWNEEVRHVADQVDLQVPTEVAFGMATRSTIQSAIDRPVARKVTEIIAVPLFISSHSSVIESQAYLLGLRAQMPDELKEFAAMDHGSMDHGGAMDNSVMHDAGAAADAMKPVVSPVPLRETPALNANPIVADILVDRAASISHDPRQEVVILIAHGPVPERDNKLWLRDMDILAKDMGRQSHYAGIENLTLRDDADAPVRDAATQQLRQKVEQATKKGNTALSVPLLLSYGGIEGGLRKRLDGLTYRMPDQALLPDKRIVNWVVETAHATSSQTDTATK